MAEEERVELSEQDLELMRKLQSQPGLDFQNINWVQRGYELIGTVNGVRQGIPIPKGKMLIGERGSYKLVDEIAARV